MSKANVLEFFHKYYVENHPRPRAIHQIFNTEELIILQGLIQKHNADMLVQAKMVLINLKEKPEFGEHLGASVDKNVLQVAKTLLEAKIEIVIKQLDLAKTTISLLGLDTLLDPKSYWNKWVYNPKRGLVSDILPTKKTHKIVCKKANKLMEKYKALVDMSYSICYALGIKDDD